MKKTTGARGPHRSCSRPRARSGRGPPTRRCSLATAGLAAGFIAVGCWTEATSPERPLTVRLSADKTTARIAEEIAFQVEANGSALAGIAVDYGDGQADSLVASGAQRATMRTRHVYSDTGSYLVRATAQELTGQSAFDEVSIRIVRP